VVHVLCYGAVLCASGMCSVLHVWRCDVIVEILQLCVMRWGSV
jgi:hypothetical protein